MDAAAQPHREPGPVIAIRVRALLLAGSLALAGCAAGASPPSGDTPAFGHLGVETTLRTDHPRAPAGQPVSLVRLAADTYLVCDYANVYRVARSASGYTVTALAAPPVPVWTPAALEYRNGRLYVANYRGQDVLELRLDGDRLDLVRTIASPQLAEPKHVQAEADGSVTVADHIGNGVLRFRPDGTLEWRVRVNQANGLVESGGFVYATSLQSGTIVKIDRAGHILATAGSMGSSLGSYLLPVDLADLGGRIAVTDPPNGRITLLDHDLRVVGHAGANGPGLDALNYPYATLAVPDGYVIADTFKQRLLHVNRAWSIEEQIAFGRLVPAGRQRPLVFGTAARPSTYDMLPGLDIAAELRLRQPLDFVGGYAGLDHVASGRVAAHLDLSDPDFGDTNAVWAGRVGRYIVAGSAESYLLEVIDPTTAMFTYVDVGEDNWWLTGWLLTPANLPLALVDVIRPALAVFDRAQRLLDAGATRPAVLHDVLGWSLTRSPAQDLTSAAGLRFLRGAMTREDADRYFTAVMGQPRQRVIELLAVKFLSGY
jgi:hypothetical protein